jgi:hypothetical protein
MRKLRDQAWDHYSTAFADPARITRRGIEVHCEV